MNAATNGYYTEHSWVDMAAGNEYANSVNAHNTEKGGIFPMPNEEKDLSGYEKMRRMMKEYEEWKASLTPEELTAWEKKMEAAIHRLHLDTIEPDWD